MYSLFFVSYFFSSLCTVLLTIMFLVTYFLSLLEFINFYLRQQKRKHCVKRTGKRQKQKTESKEPVVVFNEVTEDVKVLCVMKRLVNHTPNMCL